MAGSVVTFGPYNGRDLTDVRQVPENCSILPTSSAVLVSRDRASPFIGWLNGCRYKMVEKQDAGSENTYPRLARYLTENGTKAVLLFVASMEETKLAVSIHSESISHFYWIVNLVITWS